MSLFSGLCFLSCIVRVCIGSETFLQAEISSQSQIIGLTSDASIVVFGARNNDVVQLTYENESLPLTAQIITRTTDQIDEPVTLVFDCGYFWRLGKYNIQLRSSSSVLPGEFDWCDNNDLLPTEQNPSINTTIIVSDWPKLRLKLKEFHEALSTDVQILVSPPRQVCASKVLTQVPFEIRMMRNDTVVQVQEVSFPPSSLVFSCKTFSLPGTYKAQLVASHQEDDVLIAESKEMSVHWSNEYSLTITGGPTLCADGFVGVKAERPPCTSDADTLQVVEIYRNRSEQVVESLMWNGRDHLLLDCEYLHLNENTTGVCFRYSTSGNVVRTTCMKTSTNSGLNIDGMWTFWSPWSHCQRPCRRSVWRRIRNCDNPKPRGEGAKCTGDAELRGNEVEAQFRDDDRNHGICPFTASGESPADSSNSCKCGCDVRALPETKLLLSAVAGECQSRNTTEWKVFATGPRFAIHFRVVDFQLSPGEILIVADQQQTFRFTSKLQHATSQRHIATVRYISPPTSSMEKSCGFVLSYTAIEKLSLQPSIPPNRENITTTRNELDSSWIDTITKNPVMIGAISACALIIGVVCVVIIRYKCAARGKTREQFNTAKSRLTTPPDGKSTSNFDTDSVLDDHQKQLKGFANFSTERPQPLGGDKECSTATPTSRPRTAYYLAQRQLRLMKKHGQQAACQTYATTSMNDDLLREQEDLLFGTLSDTTGNAS